MKTNSEPRSRRKVVRFAIRLKARRPTPARSVFDFATPEEAAGFIAGVRECARFIGDDDPLNRLVDTELVAPPEPWSHGTTGKWIVVIKRAIRP